MSQIELSKSNESTKFPTSQASQQDITVHTYQNPRLKLSKLWHQNKDLSYSPLEVTNLLKHYKQLQVYIQDSHLISDFLMANKARSLIFTCTHDQLTNIDSFCEFLENYRPIDTLNYEFKFKKCKQAKTEIFRSFMIRIERPYRNSKEIRPDSELSLDDIREIERQFRVGCDPLVRDHLVAIKSRGDLEFILKTAESLRTNILDLNHHLSVSNYCSAISLTDKAKSQSSELSNQIDKKLARKIKFLRIKHNQKREAQSKQASAGQN